MGKVGDWVVVIDVGCRLSGSTAYLEEASASTDPYLVRVADHPVSLHYSSGRQVTEAHGLAACLEIAPVEYEDGETCAMRFLHNSTGISFGQDLWDAKFTLFEV